MKMSIPSFKKQLVTYIRQAELKNISSISVFSDSPFYFLLLGIFELILQFMNEHQKQFGPAFPIIEQAYQSLLKLSQPYEKETEETLLEEKQEILQGEGAQEAESKDEELIHVEAYDRKVPEKTQNGKEKSPNLAEKIEELQAEIEKLKGDKAFLESKVLEEQQRSEEFRLEVVDLKLKNSSKTSHTPPSQERYPRIQTYHNDRKDYKKEDKSESEALQAEEVAEEIKGEFKPKGIGGQPGHTGNTPVVKENVPPDKVVYCYPEGMSQEEIESHEWKQVDYHDMVEIIQQTELTRYIKMETTIPGKRGPKTIEGAYPKTARSQLSYGMTVTSNIYTNYSIGLVAVNRQAEILRYQYGITISPATVQNLIRKGSVNFFKARDLIIEAMKKEGAQESAVFGADETSVNVNGTLFWEHILVSKSYTLYTVDETRGIQGLYASGVLENFKGTLVCDFYQMYSSKRFSSLARCWSHLERELAGANIKQSDLEWIDRMLEFAEDSYEAYITALENGTTVPEEILEKLDKEYDEIIALGNMEKEGMVKSSENLLTRFQDNKDEMLAHLYNTDIPRTNNWSEQAARQVKMKLDVSKQFKTKFGVEIFNALRSVVDTGIKQGLNPIETINQVLGGNINYIFTHEIDESLSSTGIKKLEVVQGKQNKSK